MATRDGSDSDSLSSSSSSDDEFLTIKDGNGAGSEDREALVRKKLLESFYGAAAVQQQEEEAPHAARQSELADDAAEINNSQDGDDDGTNEDEQRIQGAAKDLDSPYFAHGGFVREHVVGSSIHNLLETEERLALQVRTLDSTMQTLVYENYSKFIDATDAIKSIGVSCSANEDGLASLSRGMQTIDERSRDVEDALGSLRDAVAEKLRVKRLLTRLDALLKLPSTLRHQIEAGKFRLATKSYVAAHSILSKHSMGFESLKTIEAECNTILTEMVLELKRKLTHWSRRMTLLNSEEDEATDDWVAPPEPPETMSEIFEAAGTLLIDFPGRKAEDHQVSFDSGLSPDDVKSMALSAAHRLLDRILDAHQIELQGSMFSTSTFEEDTYEAKLSKIHQVSTEPDASLLPKGNKFVPTAFLDNVLEAATLFGISFGGGASPCLDASDKLILVDFVSFAFSSFLGHVRTILLEQQAIQADRSLCEATVEEDDEEYDDGDVAYGEISGAMTYLLRSVRDVASGLALPEVGIDVEFASSLVDRAIEVTEAMVRRRVSQKFYSLRLRVVEECLGPFAKEAMSYSAENEVRVTQIVQMASVALSDGMQMVDDTIRSVLMGGVVISSAKGVDYEMIKAAVKGSCKRFAAWLASALERLAGLESNDPRLTVGTSPSSNAEEDDATVVSTAVPDSLTAALDNMSEASDDLDASTDKVESVFGELVVDLHREASATVLADFTLAIAEMCRLAERSVMENINRSIQASSQSEKRAHKSSDIFQTGGPSTTANGSSSEQDKVTSDRFLLAASRVLTMYAMARGFDAATVACEGFSALALLDEKSVPLGPRAGICQLLEITKLSCLDCANVFGGDRRADPVPDFLEQDDYESGRSSAFNRKSLAGHGLRVIKGLQLDVERMFKEKVPIYPNPLRPVEFTRNEVITILLKVALRAVVEQVRSSRFTGGGYRQLQVDVALLRHMVPHFLVDEIVSDGMNGRSSVLGLLEDVVDLAGSRCLDETSAGSDAFVDDHGRSLTPMMIVRNFFSDEEGYSQRFVVDEDNR